MLKKFLVASAIATGMAGLFVGGNAFAASYTSGQNISVSGDINVCVSKTGGYTGDAIIADIRGTNYEKQIVFSDASCVAVADIPSDTNLKFIAPMGMGGLEYTSESGTVALNLDNATTVDKYLKISGSMGQRVEAQIIGTTLQIGRNVNMALKRLVGNGTEIYTTPDTNIKSIQFVDELPTSINPDVANKVNIAESGETPVYAYADDAGNVYIHSNGKKLYANEDSSNMFSYLSGLTSITITDALVTTNVTAMNNFFYYADALTTLTLPNSFDTSNVIYMGSMFSRMSALTTLVFPEVTFDTSNTTDMSYMFAWTDHLTSLTLPNSFDTSSAEKMNNMFAWMTALTTLSLPEGSFNPSHVTDMQMMFYHLDSLTNFVLPGSFDTSSAETMNSMFAQMYNITSLEIPAAFSTVSATTTSNMFSQMYALTSLTLPDSFDTSSVANMDSMFARMDSLGTLNLPDSFTIGSSTSTNNIFYNTPTTAVLCAIDPTARSLWPGIFCGTTKLQSGQSVNEAIKRLAGDEGARYYDDNTSIKAIRFVDELPNGINPDTTAKANIGLDGLTPVYAYWDGNGNIYINSEAELIYANEASSSMFQDFVGLTTLDFSSIFSTAKVTNMRLFFYGNTELTSLILPSTFDTSKVTTMQQMFQNMSALIELHLPESFNTSNVQNMNYMFAGMTNLTTLTFTDAFNTENVENMAQMFHNMTSLTSLTLPETFNTSKVTTMNQMFLLCSSLTSLTLPAAFNTSKVDDMTQMFLLTTSLTELTLPDAFIVKDGASTDGIFATTSSTAVLNATNATIRSLWPGVLGN